MKTRKIVLVVLLVVVALATACLLWIRNQDPFELRFVKHVQDGPTHVVVFRLKSNIWRAVDLQNEGEILTGTGQFPARWAKGSNLRVGARQKKEFAIIAPYDRTPWKLQLSVAPRTSPFWRKVRASWHVIKTERTKAGPALKSIWHPSPNLGYWLYLPVDGSGRSRLETIISDTVTNVPVEK